MSREGQNPLEESSIDASDKTSIDSGLLGEGEIIENRFKQRCQKLHVARKGEVEMTAVQKRKLLIVDDEPELREVLQLNLRKLGLEMHTAENGRDALQKAMADTYDAILCDLSMPIMDGLEFIAKLKANTVETPVVILTAHDNKDNMLRALQTGAFDFIEKPYEPVSLIDTVKKALDVGSHLKMVGDNADADIPEEHKKHEAERQKKMIQLAKIVRPK